MMEPHGGLPVEQWGAALGESPAVAILVHGRNAAPRNIIDLARVLDRPGFTHLAPAAAGHTWYPYSFMAETAKNEPGLTSALTMLADLVASLIARGIRHEHIVLLGFSQGACLAAEFAVRNATRYGGIVAYSASLTADVTFLLPFAAGNFIYIAAADLIPEIKHEESATLNVVHFLSFLAGIALLLGVRLVFEH